MTVLCCCYVFRNVSRPLFPQNSSQIFYRHRQAITANFFIVLFLIAYTLFGGFVFLHFEVFSSLLLPQVSPGFHGVARALGGRRSARRRRQCSQMSSGHRPCVDSRGLPFEQQTNNHTKNASIPRISRHFPSHLTFKMIAVSLRGISQDEQDGRPAELHPHGARQVRFLHPNTESIGGTLRVIFGAALHVASRRDGHLLFASQFRVQTPALLLRLPPCSFVVSEASS